MSVIGKVKCRVCENEDNGFCKVKQCTVKTNKARHCQAFIMNESKIKVSIKPKSNLRPDWYWNRKKVIKEAKEEFKRQQELEAVQKTKQPADLAKPDVLSKFRSSATNDEEKKD